MNRDVIIYAIKDLKNIINKLESRETIFEEDYIKLEKEINSFLCNLSAYKFRNIKKYNILLSGFQYAFNLMKHEKRLTTVKKVKQGGFTFPIDFPLNIPNNKIYWIDVKNIKPDKNFINQYNCYLKSLNNHRIINTITDLEKII